MRNVYPTDQVIHIWAHQGQESARNGSNVSFDGPALYSYSTTIAAIIDGIVYISDNNMSVTTAKHIRAASSATRHLEQFRTTAFSWFGNNPRLTHDAMIQPAARDAVKTLNYALENTKTRKQTKLNAIMAYIQERERIVTHAARFNVSVNMPDIQAGPEAIAEYQERKAAERAAAEAVRLKAQKKQQKEDAKQFKIWLTTGAGRCPASYSRAVSYYGTTTGAGRGTDFITLKPDSLLIAAGTAQYKIVTSQGAECPLDHAIKALRFWIKSNYQERDTLTGSARYTQRWTPYHTNGHKIPLGIFTLDSIDESGTVKAGCHTFTAAEIQRFIDQWREVLVL